MTLPEASLAPIALASLAGPTLDAAAWLLAQAPQIAPTLPDTLLMRQVGSEPTMLARFAEVLRALMTLALLVLTVAVVPAAWNFRRSYQKISDLLDRVYADVNPLTHHAARIAENVDYVSTAIRADVQRASATLSEANARLQEAVRQAERRAKEFDALLSVVQEEAETTFVSAAAAVRGVRSGVGQLRDDLTSPAFSARGRRRTAARLRELADAGPPGAEWAAAEDEPIESDVPPRDAPDSLAAVDVGSVPPPAERRAAAGRGEELDFVEDDTLEDFYDLGEADDGEDDRSALGSPERPRVRPRRDRRE